MEWQLSGEGPWQLASDCDIIFTPGHTRGCISLLYKPEQALFTGDHLVGVVCLVACMSCFHDKRKYNHNNNVPKQPLPPTHPLAGLL